MSEVTTRVSNSTGANAVHLRNSLAEREPAAATFVGVELTEEAGALTWTAVIVGDSCLFHIRGDKFRCYPVQSVTDFDSHPQYFSSIAERQPYAPAWFKETLLPGDLLILATDAMAKWILGQLNDLADWRPLARQFAALETWAELYGLVNAARANATYRLEDDDVALIVLEVVETVTDPNMGLLRSQASAPAPVPTGPSQPPRETRPTPVPSKLTLGSAPPPPPSARPGCSSVAVWVALGLALVGLCASAAAILGVHLGPALLRPTPQVSATPKAAPASHTTVLPAATPIRLRPDDGSPVVATTDTDGPVRVLSTVVVNGRTWLEIEVDAWTSTPPGNVSARRLATHESTSAASRNTSQDPAPSAPAYVMSVGAQPGLWFPVRTVGFVPRG